jgi:hypothetical protein
MTTELASPLALQVRRGAIAPEESQQAWQPRILRLPPLRGGHALQLASFDRGLCKAAAHHQVAHQQLVIGASLKKPRSLLSGSHLRPQRQVLAKLARLIKCGVESCAGQHAGCQKPALATGEGSPGR